MDDPNPIQPLSPDQLAAQEQRALQEGYVHRVAVGLDDFVNIMLDGSPDETISSRMARWATEDAGLKRDIGRKVSAALNLAQPDHGARAEAADLTRGLAVEAIELKAEQVSQPTVAP
jgi:hypothetical protein